MGRVADGADEPGETGIVVADGEVVEERPEHSATEPSPEHDLVGGRAVGMPRQSHRTG